MFAVLHSDIKSLKSGLLHLTGQPYCKKNRLAKVKDGIVNLFLRNYLVDRYTCLGHLGKIGSFLFLWCHTRWPRQVRKAISRGDIADIFE
jgi:hypothetical protein